MISISIHGLVLCLFVCVFDRFLVMGVVVLITVIGNLFDAYHVRWKHYSSKVQTHYFKKEHSNRTGFPFAKYKSSLQSDMINCLMFVVVHGPSSME